MTTSTLFQAASLPKYKQNLAVDMTTGKVYSYATHVATIDHAGQTVTALGYYSVTTSKHVGYVARMLGYTLIKQPKN